MSEQEFEYKFIRMKGNFFGSMKQPEAEYQNVVHEHAKQGWRLVQIFAPGIGGYGASTFYELILERRIQPKQLL